MNRKTLQLLLHHYQDMHEEMVPCAEKSKFAKLIKEKVFILKLKHLALHLAFYIKRNTKDKDDERKYFARNAK